MTIDQNMFLPTALSGKAAIITDPANAWFTQTGQILGPTVDAAVSPASTMQTALCAVSIPIPDAATTTYTFIVTDACEVVDVIVRKSGAGAANTIQILNGASTAISDAIAAAVDKAITRAGTLDPATTSLAAGAQLKVTATKAAGTMLANVTVIFRRR